MSDFLQRLRERKLVQWALAYVAAAFALIQVLDIVAQRFGWPEQAVRFCIIALAVGFFVTLVLAWYHGERGEQRVTGTELLIVALLLGIGGVAAWKLAPGKREPAANAPAAGAPVTNASEAGDQAAGAAPAVTKSIAVLPFVDLSPAHDQEYFTDGLSEEILNSLARIDGMLVVGRTSSFQFKGKNEDLRAIGQKLGVANLLEGSVRREDEHARITAQLIRASDGIHLWSQTYDRTLTDTLAVQLDIAEQVAGVLDVVLDDRQRARMRDAGVKNVDAFIAYQKGLKLYTDAHNRNLGKDAVDGLRIANVEFDRAVALEPHFADAYYAAADLYDHILLADDRAPAERGDAQKAVFHYLDQAASNSHDDQQRLLILADRQLISDDWHGLPGQIDAALTHPGCVSPDWLPVFASAFGYGDKIDDLLARVSACDPLNGQNFTSRLAAALESGKADRALAIFASPRAPASSGRSHYRLQGLLISGQMAQAHALLAEMIPDSEGYLTSLAMVGRVDGESPQAIKGKLERVDRSKSVLKFWAQADLQVAAILGDRAEANRRAAAIDAQPAGPFVLAVVTAYCLCGAPFDLDATPNFKARLAESGLPWPPQPVLPFAKPATATASGAAR